jgi:hypothetical protein
MEAQSIAVVVDAIVAIVDGIVVIVDGIVVTVDGIVVPWVAGRGMPVLLLPARRNATNRAPPK